MNFKLFIFVSFLLSSSIVTAQISISTTTIDNGCGLIITDTGLFENDYSPNETFTLTLCTSSDSIINLYFNQFDLGIGDTIKLFDGESILSPEIGEYSLQELEDQTILATAGCITIVFTSDSLMEGNFSFDVSCENPCTPPIPIVSVDSVFDSVYFICPGEEVIFDASTSILYNATEISSFEWNFGDGNYNTISWPSATHIYQGPGAHNVFLSITDDLGCVSEVELDILILSSASPLWDSEISESFCVDFNQLLAEDEINLTIAQELLNYTFTELPFVFGNGNEFYIPDDQQNVLSDAYLITGFSDTATITNYYDLESICINMEHSFMGDLIVELICPNGQSIVLHEQGGGGTNLGIPDQGDGNGPGQGLEYCWSPNAFNGAWEYEAEFYEALPAGTYASVESFENLTGCPINGIWGIQITDVWGADDGWVFDWAVSFADNIDSTFQYESALGLSCDSTFFSSDFFIQDENCNFEWTQLITEPGEYPVQITTTNNYGCIYTDSLEFILFANPAPTILYTNNMLYTEDTAISYQWYLDGIPISFATSETHLAITDGSYSLGVTYENGCQNISESIDFIPSHITEQLNSDQYTWHIENESLIITHPMNIINKVEIYNLTGKLIANTDQTKINISQLKNGIYFIKINYKESFKIIVTH